MERAGAKFSKTYDTLKYNLGMRLFVIIACCKRRVGVIKWRLTAPKFGFNLFGIPYVHVSYTNNELNVQMISMFTWHRFD